MDELKPFLDAINKHPEDPGPVLILADWFEEAGDQSGEELRKLVGDGLAPEYSCIGPGGIWRTGEGQSSCLPPDRDLGLNPDWTAADRSAPHVQFRYDRFAHAWLDAAAAASRVRVLSYLDCMAFYQVSSAQPYETCCGKLVGSWRARVSLPRSNRCLCCGRAARQIRYLAKQRPEWFVFAKGHNYLFHPGGFNAYVNWSYRIGTKHVSKTVSR